MEIIILPYMAISFAIGWAIFSPFAQIDELQQWTFDQIELTDLLAVFLPLSFLFAVVIWTIPIETRSVWLMALLGTAILLVAIFGLATSLFLLAKMNQTSSVKRMAMIGIIVPFGSLLTLAWIVLPLIASVYSIVYAVPTALAVIPVSFGLRWLSNWICASTIAAG